MNKETATAIIEFLKTQPDKIFKARESYNDEKELEQYIEERTEAVMKPIEKQWAESQEKSRQREKELEKKILEWSRVPGNLVPGMRVKLKGTRDRGYRIIYSIGSDHVVGFQFYYSRPWGKPGGIVELDSTTTNHVTKLRKVLLGGKWTPIREIIEKRK